MRYLRFLILLVRRGSLSQKPFDFEADRRKGIDASYVSPEIIPKNNPLKRYLLRTSWGYSLMSNLAYLSNAAGMNKMYYISEEHKLIYVRILKSASTSVLKEFLPLIEPGLRNINFTEEQLDTLGYYHAKREMTFAQQKYKKFAVVRDPFRRIVSVYLDLFDPDTPRFTYATYWFGVLRKEMTFKNFIKTISSIPPSLSGPHMAPQSRILSAAGELRDISIFRIEEPDDLEKFMAEYGMAIPHLNRQPMYDYRSFYDPETLSLVYKLYKDDIRLLGYTQQYGTLCNFIAWAYEKRAL